MEICFLVPREIIDAEKCHLVADTVSVVQHVRRSLAVSVLVMFPLLPQPFDTRPYLILSQQSQAFISLIKRFILFKYHSIYTLLDTWMKTVNGYVLFFFNHKP